MEDEGKKEEEDTTATVAGAMAGGRGERCMHIIPGRDS